MKERFEIVGIRPLPDPPVRKRKWHEGKPLLSAGVLALIVLGCLLLPLMGTRDPSYMDLTRCSVPPGKAFLFGTDAMGRDVFSMIWYGGRLSLFIGVAAALLSAAIAILFGAASGCAPAWLDGLLMRLTEILLSVPNLLVVVLLQAVLGKASPLSIALVIGVTSWTGMAKIVRTEVRQIRASEYVLASRCMGGGFFHILWRHLTPNFVSSIMFMEVVTWGSMLSLSEKALLSGAWWIILIPGGFLVAALLCITSLGSCLRRNINRRENNLY